MIVRFLFLLCWLFIGSSQAFAVSFDEARHLLARTGFGTASPEEIDKILPLSYEAAVDQILDGVLDKAITPLPEFHSYPFEWPNLKYYDALALEDFRQRVRRDHRLIKSWWVQEMMDTPSPFTEHMALFWHNHFVSEINKVKFGQWMHEQNAIFRKYAIGDFRKLLTKISIGPAMLRYLDANRNKKNKPNENFAREVLELFTLGEGQGYTELDIRESARAYTGWRINYNTAGYEFKLRLHDDSVKTILGKTGTFRGIDVFEIILEQPRVAEFLAGKLWQEFVSLEPNQAEIKRLAKIIRKHNYDLKPMFKALFMSDSFRDPDNRGALIKSPVELTIGTLRLLGLKPLEARMIWARQRDLGQNLFNPPDVKGWRGGAAWITSTTTLRRALFLKEVLYGIKQFRAEQELMTVEMGKLPFGIANPGRLLQREKANPGYLKKLLLAIDPVLQKTFSGEEIKVIGNLLLDPAYQVK